MNTRRRRLKVLFLHLYALLSLLKDGVTMMPPLPPPEHVLTSAMSDASESSSASVVYVKPHPPKIISGTTDFLIQRVCSILVHISVQSLHQRILVAPVLSTTTPPRQPNFVYLPRTTPWRALQVGLCRHRHADISLLHSIQAKHEMVTQRSCNEGSSIRPAIRGG